MRALGPVLIYVLISFIVGAALSSAMNLNLGVALGMSFLAFGAVALFTGAFKTSDS